MSQASHSLGPSIYDVGIFRGVEVKILLNLPNHSKIEKILKGSLDAISSPSPSNYGRESLFEM